jgi:hypothetical protein
MNAKLIGIVLVLCSCQGNKSNKDVLQFREALPKIETPIKFDSNRKAKYKAVDLEGNELIKKISDRSTFSLLGKLFETEENITILGYTSDVFGTPVLITFDNNGNEVGSHRVYETVTSDSAVQTSNIVTILPSREILFTDSTIIKKPIVHGVDGSNGNDSLSVTRKKYLISKSGKVESVGQ